ncbi:hypothetical protein B7P43_G17600 [Cryptotermes secundus]|uniref:Gustatory receptor n=1 Tax=Cryptotermes secundus TaxID=105785 RepID=A0A2J7QY57_9NEOP|nr:hypothetical protein B7P43_G17600 [Cryptotermes secundus]
MKSIFEATDIYSAVWPLHFVSRILGLATYSLKPHIQSAKYETFSTYLYRIWSIFWITLLVVSEYIHTTRSIDASETLKQKATDTLRNSSLYSYSIVTVLLSLTVNRGKVPEILGKFAEIDQLFSSKLYRIQIYKNTKLFLSFQFSIMTTVIIIILASIIFFTHGNFGYSDIYIIFTQTLSLFLNCTSILYFVNLVLLLRNKYKYLNSVLESSAITPCNITNLKYRNSNFVTPIDTFRMKLSLAELRDNSMLSRRQHVRNLRIIYSKLQDVAVLINSTYGFSLLCAIIWVFISIISGANNALQLNGANHIYVIEAVLWIFFSVGLMTVMTVSCSLAVNECNRSHVIVQKIMLRDDIDNEVIKQLKKMFTQFEFMKIGFSACGLYKIDLSFLCGIIGATLSYVIIFSAL